MGLHLDASSYICQQLGRQITRLCFIFWYKISVSLVYCKVNASCNPYRAERPLVIQIFHGFLEQIAVNENASPVYLLEQFLEYLSKSLLTKKPAMQFNKNVLASLFFMQNESSDRETTLPFSWINDHMAIFSVSGSYLEHNLDYYETRLVSGERYSKNEEFLGIEPYLILNNRQDLMAVAGSYFRPFSEESLLRLAFGGIKNYNWCQDFGSTCTQLINRQATRLSGFEFTHHSKSRNGNLFESLVSVAVVQASRRYGLKGTPLNDYSKGLLENLVSLSLRSNEAYVDFSEFNVPFIGPIDGAWPDTFMDWSQKDANVILLNAKTPENKYGVALAAFTADGFPFLMVESKNREDALTVTVLVTVIKKFFDYADIDTHVAVTDAFD